jgi:cytosine/adenosine deaminase-related metal-dependent hydrolase
MLNAMRNTIINGTVNHVHNKVEPVNWMNAFYLATLGGSKLINMEDKIGILSFILK